MSDDMDKQPTARPVMIRLDAAEFEALETYAREHDRSLAYSARHLMRVGLEFALADRVTTESAVRHGA